MKPLTTYFIFVLSAVLLLLAASTVANAAEPKGFVPLAPIPGTVYKDNVECKLGPGNWALDCTSNLSRYLRGLYNTGVALAGFFAVFSIVRGGFELLFTDSILGKLEGKTIILQTIGGLIIVFASYILMNMINPQLAKDLDITLVFPRPTILKGDDALLKVYSELEAKQKAEMENITEEVRRTRATAEDLENRAKALRAASNIPTNPTDAQIKEFTQQQKDDYAKVSADELIAKELRAEGVARAQVQTAYSKGVYMLEHNKEMGDASVLAKSPTEIGIKVREAIREIRKTGRERGSALHAVGLTEQGNKIYEEAEKAANTLQTKLDAWWGTDSGGTGGFGGG